MPLPSLPSNNFIIACKHILAPPHCGIAIRRGRQPPGEDPRSQKPALSTNHSLICPQWLVNARCWVLLLVYNLPAQGIYPQNSPVSFLQFGQDSYLGATITQLNHSENLNFGNSTNMSSGFVSGGTIENPTERDDEWRRAQAELAEKRRLKEEEGQQNDGKSLYEVLQANKGDTGATNL